MNDSGKLNEKWDVYGVALPDGAVALVQVCQETGQALPENDLHLREKYNPGVAENRVAAARRAADILATAINNGDCSPDLIDFNYQNTSVYTRVLAAIINLPVREDE